MVKKRVKGQEVYFHFRMPKDLREQITIAAEREERTDAEWTRRAIRAALRSGGIIPPEDPDPLEIIAAWLTERPALQLDAALRTAALPAELPAHVRAVLDRLRRK